MFDLELAAFQNRGKIRFYQGLGGRGFGFRLHAGGTGDRRVMVVATTTTVVGSAVHHACCSLYLSFERLLDYHAALETLYARPQ